MKNITVILQARTSSTRLPGKVLKPILGKPMLLYQIERIKRSKLVNRIIVATSTDTSDDSIAKMCLDNAINCYRGSLRDVLDRFYECAIHYSAYKNIIRLTGDCPLTDPKLLDEIITFFFSGQYDYASNTIRRTFPHGLDIEIFKFSCLEDAWREGKSPYQREHVTPFVYQSEGRYRLGSFETTNDLSNYRWTVDEPMDFILIEQIYQELYASNHNFSTEDVLKLIKDKPFLATINKK